MLPPPVVRRRVTRASTSLPDHAVTLPPSNTNQMDRTFIHTGVRVWNSLPDNVVGRLSSSGLQSFKTRAHKFLVK